MPCVSAFNSQSSGSCKPDDAKGHRVHAVTESCWPGTIIEDMAKMSFAQPARNCRARHAERKVGAFSDIFFRDWLPKAGPPRTRLEFGIRAKERRVATDAAVKTFVVQVPIL